MEVSGLEHQAKKEAGRVLVQRVSRRLLRERQTERQTERDRQTDRQRERETDRDREHKVKLKKVNTQG